MKCIAYRQTMARAPQLHAMVNAIREIRGQSPLYVYGRAKKERASSPLVIDAGEGSVYWDAAEPGLSDLFSERFMLVAQTPEDRKKDRAATAARRAVRRR